MKMQHRLLLIECKGTAAVEFALVGPVFLLLLLSPCRQRSCCGQKRDTSGSLADRSVYRP